MKTVAEFKRTCHNYTCELLDSMMGPVHPGHRAYGMKRCIVKKQSKEIKFSNGSWMEFPKASQAEFEDIENGFILTVRVDGILMTKQRWERKPKDEDFLPGQVLTAELDANGDIQIAEDSPYERN